jgi:hypothetical protein
MHITILAHLDKYTDDGVQPGWNPSHADILAGDWMVMFEANLRTAGVKE